MTTQSRARMLAVPMLAVAIALGACGSDDDQGAETAAEAMTATGTTGSPTTENARSDSVNEPAGTDAVSTYTAMLDALAAGRPAEACTAMTGDMRKGFGGGQGAACAERLGGSNAAEALLRRPRILGSEVDGDSARIHVQLKDTRYDVLMVKLGDGWKVAGASPPE